MTAVRLFREMTCRPTSKVPLLIIMHQQIDCERFFQSWELFLSFSEGPVTQHPTSAFEGFRMTLKKRKEKKLHKLTVV